MVFGNNKIKNLQIILGILIVVAFVFLQLTLKSTIFFNYDMPRVALMVQDYLSRGTYMTSQYFFSEASWLNVAWGPVFIFFYAILLKISADPMVVANILVLLNIFGIVSIIILGWKYFSPTIGLISGFILAFNPYWFSYTRLIYQPSPMTIFIPIAMLITFEAINKKPLALFLQPIIWVVLFQIYIPTYAFIAVSILFLIFNLNKKSIKYLLFGSLVSLVFIVPSIKFYKENPIYINRFFNAPEQFLPPEKSITERVKDVTSSFLQIPVGGMFEWQSGYGYTDLIKDYLPYKDFFDKVSAFMFLTSILIVLWQSIRRKDWKSGLILSWALCPFLSLIILQVPFLPPRYFLLGIPASMFLISLSASYLKRFFWIFPILIGFIWIIENIQYSNFIYNYNYPQGKFQDISEVPYVFLKKSMDYVVSDSNAQNCNNLIMSNDTSDINFNLWMESEYIWKYLYKRQADKNNVDGCHYVIICGQTRY